MSAGRHLRPGGRGRSWSGVGAAAWLLWLPLRALGTRLGRRLATVAVLTTFLVGLMTVLYEHADPPAASARQRPAPPPGPAPAGGPVPATPRATTAPGVPAVGARTPEQAAVAWYAARLGLAAGRVRALGSQRPGPGRARVLLLADPGAGRLATTWVGLHHTPAGWTVTP